MRKTIRYTLLGLLLTGLVFISWISKRDQHGSSERDLPVAVNSLFAGSGRCIGCHGYDPQHLASVDSGGNDVNVVDDWRSSMMANSARDPFWLAKVSHETLVNPGHKIQLEDKCTSCHAPMGHFDAKHQGQTHYSLAALQSDPLAKDGVSCAICHQMDPAFQGKYFSGNLVFDTTKSIYGPYDNPFAAPMLSFLGYDTKYEPAITSSTLCAGCHTLITETVDLTGNYTGDFFVEQATYHEWLNSQYSSGITKRECRSCHIPRINDPVALSIDYEFVGGRSPFGKHLLAGANVFMLQLMKNNIDSLGLEASAVDFDNTIDHTLKMLQDSSVHLTVTRQAIANDTGYYLVALENLAGHKLPSGYPSRRIFVQFILLDQNGDTLFVSGKWDENFEVLGHDPVYEPHYDLINDPNQVQIYEMVFGDVNGNKTTVLERGLAPLKDNRLPPKGFTTLHGSYDTVQVAGNALSDNNFNRMGAVEGTGSDSVYYRIGLNGYTGPLTAVCRLYYQTAPPAWMAEMFEYSSPAIDQFRNMFNLADREPILMKQAIDGDLFNGMAKWVRSPFYVYPNPCSGMFYLAGVEPYEIRTVQVFSLEGKQMVTFHEPSRGYSVRLSPGLYIVRVNLRNHDTVTARVMIR